MASNSFGEILRITTWGESHGKALGVVIDGFPAGISICESRINDKLEKRSPGRNSYTTPRKEPDKVEILSGVFEGLSTGTPISLLIWNKDADSSKYESIKDILRPGHANFCYEEKYGIFDYRGGGRASARETAVRVAAGAVVLELLKFYDIEVIAFLSQVGNVRLLTVEIDFKTLKEKKDNSIIFCPNQETEKQMLQAVKCAKESNDSVGGVVDFIINNVPVGLGDPVFQKIEARLATAMMSIPATKGFEIGSGFSSVEMKGSAHNDLFFVEEEKIKTKTNNAGGVLGGISSGMPISGRVAFKATSSIAQSQKSIDLNGETKFLDLPKGSRHDPCVALRAPPIVEAMAVLVIGDAIMMNKGSKI